MLVFSVCEYSTTAFTMFSCFHLVLSCFVRLGEVVGFCNAHLCRESEPPLFEPVGWVATLHSAMG